MYCLIIVLFSNISNIPPNIPPFCTSQNLFSVARVRPLEIPKVQILQVGDCMGLMFQTGLLWGCFASAVWQGGFNRLHGAGLVSGSGRQTARGGAACRDALPEKTKLGTAGGQGNRPCPVLIFRNPAAFALRNIPKRTLDYLECARIAFIWPDNGM